MRPRSLISMLLLCVTSLPVRLLGAQEHVPAEHVTPTPQDASASLEDTVRTLAVAWLQANDGVGISIGIYERGKYRAFNFGTTVLDGNKVPTAATVYEIGSLGKTFTGQLLARAIVEGKVAENDDVRKYLDGEYPNLQYQGEPVRLLHLANMTSQLPDNIPDLSRIGGSAIESAVAARLRVIEAHTREDFLRDLAQVKLTRKPGNDPAHSNAASQLLGIVLEKIHGVPFETLLAREIERPLKMASGAAPVPANLATGYDASLARMPPFGTTTQLAAGSLRYSLGDMLKFVAWQVAERDASTKLAHRANWHTLDSKQALGYYWIIGESAAGRRLRYSGGTFGFSSFCDLYPETQIGVVMLANIATAQAQSTMQAMSERIVAMLRSASDSATPAEP